MLGPRPLELLQVLDQEHEGARHQVPAHQEQQVPLLLPERPRQSLGELYFAEHSLTCWTDFGDCEYYSYNTNNRAHLSRKRS